MNGPGHNCGLTFTSLLIKSIDMHPSGRVLPFESLAEVYIGNFVSHEEIPVVKGLNGMTVWGLLEENTWS